MYYSDLWNVVDDNGWANLKEETRRLLSEKLKGRSAWNKNIPVSKETKEKIRKANLGKTMQKEIKDKISKSNKGRTKPKAT